MGIHHSTHTHPTPIPMGIPIPTAALHDYRAVIYEVCTQTPGDFTLWQVWIVRDVTMHCIPVPVLRKRTDVTSFFQLHIFSARLAGWLQAQSSCGVHLSICVSRWGHWLLGHFTFWISLSLSVSLSPKFGLRPKISRKVKSFSLNDSLRPNFGLNDRWIQS